MLFGPIGSTPIGSSTAGLSASINATAAGAVLAAAAAIAAGSATGTAAGTAPGANLRGTSSIAPGSATGTRSAAAPGTSLAALSTIQAGAATSGAGGQAAGNAGTITVPASRTARFAGSQRVAVFTDAGPVNLVKVAADQLYYVGDFTKPLADGATTASSVAFIASGIAVLEGPVVQGSLMPVKLGTLDPTGGQLTFRVTCVNGEVIDGTIIFTALDDRTQAFGKDPDDHRYYSFDVSADLALSGNTTIESVQTPLVSGVGALSVPAIQGGKAVVLIGGLDLSDGAVNSCKLVMTLATTEVINRTAYFSRQDH